VPDAAPEENGPGLQKRGANSDGRIPPGLEVAGAVRSLSTILDPQTGLNRVIRTQAISGIEARDTTWYRVQGLPTTRRIMVRMSGVVSYPGGRVERFSFTDADGDSVLSPQPGSRNLARAFFVVEHPFGRIEERAVIIGAGPDREFGTRDDNATRSLETVHRIGTDTVYHLKLRPVVGDSVVRDRERDSSRVDVEHTVTVGGIRVIQVYRTVVKGDSLRNRATRFRRVVTTSQGVTETVALGRDSGSDFTHGDTGIVRVSFTSTQSTDTLASSVFIYRVAVSDTVGRHDRNRLLSVQRDKVYRFGDVAASRFVLRPLAPVAGGDRARVGELDMKIDLRAGGSIEFSGTSTAFGYSGTWSGTSGQNGSVFFDSAGTRITSPVP
jgi:hypothetical protein